MNNPKFNGSIEREALYCRFVYILTMPNNYVEQVLLPAAEVYTLPQRDELLNSPASPIERWHGISLDGEGDKLYLRK